MSSHSSVVWQRQFVSNSLIIRARKRERNGVFVMVSPKTKTAAFGANPIPNRASILRHRHVAAV